MKILDLYITKVCNLDCEYCYVDVVKNEKHVFDREKFSQRVDLLQYDVIKFFGGEPLIRWKQIQEIISSVTVKKKNIKFVIVTNGLLIDDKKIPFLQQYDVECMVSIHDGGYERLKKKIPTLLLLKHLVGFYIIFDPDSLHVSLKKFLYFFSKGFVNFSFAPQIYADWTNTNLISLEKTLHILTSYILKHNIRVAGIPTNYLKDMNFGCEKFVYDEHGMFQPCNRFPSLKKIEKFSYSKIYEYFNDEIGYKSNPLRWFYTCPVGWYLDNSEKNLQLSVQAFEKLNLIFIQFYKKLNQGKHNFLSEGIEEIRFNMTKQCNLRCKYCYVDFSDDVLDVRVGKNIIDFFLEQPGKKKILSFFGGEPLLEFDTLKKLVEYAHGKSKHLQKSLNYKIATNFILLNQERIDFLLAHNFEFHISFNGSEELNNAMRDNSSKIVLRQLERYGDSIPDENITILLAFSANEISYLKKSIIYIYNLGYKRINLEMVFGEEYVWNHGHISEVKDILQYITQNFSDICLLNTQKKNMFLDIDTKGRCSDNSLSFFGKSIDIRHKNYFDTIFTELS